MLEPYYGEFLINPIPLELSLNFCSHKCSYCFANLNRPGRKLDAPRLMRFLADYKKRDTLAARLLQAGYPVVISNRVDPFANSNYQISLPLLEILTTLGIPVQFQTKGGQGIDDALGIVGPSVWYVSITTFNDTLRQKIEPGAPSIPARFELIEKVIDRGHRVVVGINPCVKEWLPDPAALVERLKALGVWGVWVERLHLNPDQLKNMRPRERQALGETIITRARKRKVPPADEQIFNQVTGLAQQAGLEVYSVGQYTPSNFFAPYRDIYPQTFPIMQDFINLCFEANYTPDDLITFEHFATFMLPSLPQGLFKGMSSYLGAINRKITAEYKVPYAMTYSQLLSILWDHPTTKFSVVNHHNFAYAGLADEQGWALLVDEDDMPYVVFSPWFEGYYTLVNNQRVAEVI